MANAEKRRDRRDRRYREQDGRCCYCRGPMFAEPVQPAVPYMVTLEHLHQRVMGGGDETTNLLVACHGCNTRRPNGMSPSYFAVLRILLLPVWPACTYPLPHVQETLRGLGKPFPPKAPKPGGKAIAKPL